MNNWNIPEACLLHSSRDHTNSSCSLPTHFLQKCWNSLKKKKEKQLEKKLARTWEYVQFSFCYTLWFIVTKWKQSESDFKRKKNPSGLKTLCRLRLVHVTKLLWIILSWRIESHEHVIMLYGNVITKRRRAPLWEGRASDTSKIPHSHII